MLTTLIGKFKKYILNKVYILHYKMKLFYTTDVDNPTEIIETI